MHWPIISRLSFSLDIVFLCLSYLILAAVAKDINHQSQLMVIFKGKQAGENRALSKRRLHNTTKMVL